MVKKMDNNNMEYPEIEQDHKKGPGWFLILSYIIIILSAILYFVFNKDWKSSYDLQQEEIQKKIEIVKSKEKK